MQSIPPARLGQLSDMDMRLLQVFKAVVDCGGMAAAELELNIGTSTVSRHVKDLETRLGMVLCRRGRAGFSVTSEGQRVYQETVQLLAAVEGFRQRVNDLHANMGGQLHVALFEKSVSNPQAHISAAIDRFVAQAPNVALTVHVRGIIEIERGVLDGTYQIGVVPALRAGPSSVAPSRRSSPSLRQTPLFGEHMQLYCAIGHPLAAAARQPSLDWPDLCAWPLAGLGYHSPNMQLSHHAHLVRSATAFDQEGVATLLLSGRFIGFLPDHYAAPFVQQGLLCAIQPARFFYHCDYFGIVRRSPQLPRAARLFHECMVQAHSASQTC